MPESARHYINSLNNPFEHSGVRLGWGTLVPSSLYTAYYRGTITTNVDGSFALAQLPSSGTNTLNLFYNVSGASTATWVPVAYTNATALASVMTEARIVSGGIKVLPQIAATAVPGALFAGSIPSMTNTIVTSATPQQLASSPHCKIGYGATGASAVIHPLDPNSFVFANSTAIGLTGGTLAQSSTPVIAGTGFPASTLVYFEAVLNMESISTFSSSASALTTPSISTNEEQTLSSYFPSIESMWSAISSYIPSAASVNEASSHIPDIANNVLRSAQTANSIRNQFFRMPQQNRVLIQEMD